MKKCRYKIQVGGKYTYRKTGSELDDLINSLTGKATIAEVLARVQGTEPPPRRTARLEEILITVEEYTPPPPKEEE